MTKRNKKEPPGLLLNWSAAVSYNAKTVAVRLREVLEEKDVDFQRESYQRPYSKFAFVLAVPSFTYVFRFRLKTLDAVIDVFDVRQIPGGFLSFLEVMYIGEHNYTQIGDILQSLVDNFPRPLWKFTLGQRFLNGFLSPDILRSPRRWKAWGITYNNRITYKGNNHTRGQKKDEIKKEKTAPEKGGGFKERNIENEGIGEKDSKTEE